MRSLRPWRSLLSESGFTLIELLGVAVIIIILSLMALPVYAGITDKARDAKSTEDLRVIEQALEAYRADPQYSHYPSNLNQLVADGFLKPTRFLSPWSGKDNEVHYYYAVDNLGAPNAFVLGDPGQYVNCGNDQTTPPTFCGQPSGQAWEIPATLPTNLVNVRKSR